MITPPGGGDPVEVVVGDDGKAIFHGIDWSKGTADVSAYADGYTLASVVGFKPESGYKAVALTDEAFPRLSVLRAQYIKDLLQSSSPGLADKLKASGVGSRETLIGTGRDDASDAMDRRVDFSISDC